VNCPADDAIWAALAHLDGRDPDTLPGLEFEPQRTYIAPESWLQAAGGDSSRFARFRSRGVEVWCGEGFPVLDSLDLIDVTAKRMTRDRRRMLRRAARVRPRAFPVSPELRRFLHFVLPYSRWRLARALGETALEEALLRTGTIYITATHVDFVMSMKEISMPVRLAGLDANPGWVPELGRVIHFHFVQEGRWHG
jgi:hypothetical protein